MTSESPEFIALLNKLVNETLSPEEHVLLSEQLRGNPDAIKEYLFYIDLHTGFKELEERSEEELSDSHLEQLAIAREDTHQQVNKKVSSSRKWIFKTLAMTAAASAFFVISISLWRSAALKQPVATPEVIANGSVAPSKALPERPFVLLSQAANAELFLEQIPGVGSAIQVGHQYVLSKGLMELTFENGATAVVKSPAIFTVASAMRIEMTMGRCSVYAPASAHGFEVVTPQGRVVDLGTRFSVVADELGSSDVQVVEGAVEYHQQSTGGTGSMLLEGEAVRLPSIARNTKPIPYQPQEYQNEFPDRVISYQADPAPNGKGVRDLTRVTVQRDHKIRDYAVEDLIRVDVLHFSAYSKRNSACSSEPLPDRIDEVLAKSVALNAGLTNFDSPLEPYRPAGEFKNFRDRYGLAVQFRQPVKNLRGPDVVLFELQSTAYPAGGDPFYISPIEDLSGLKTHHIKQFDITMHSKDALQVAPLFTYALDRTPRSLDQLLGAHVLDSFQLQVPFYALAVGIDLSDLGYPEDAAVPGLFIEDADHEENIALDVVFIGGLP